MSKIIWSKKLGRDEALASFEGAGVTTGYSVNGGVARISYGNQKISLYINNVFYGVICEGCINGLGIISQRSNMSLQVNVTT